MSADGFKLETSELTELEREQLQHTATLKRLADTHATLAAAQAEVARLSAAVAMNDERIIHQEIRVRIESARAAAAAAAKAAAAPTVGPTGPTT